MLLKKKKTLLKLIDFPQPQKGRPSLVSNHAFRIAAFEIFRLFTLPSDSTHNTLPNTAIHKIIAELENYFTNSNLVTDVAVKNTIDKKR